MEIRSGDDVAEVAADPERFTLTHHRAGKAEYRSGTMTGGALLHLAVAGCVFNSVRLAEERGVALRDCRISVEGGFDDAAPRSSGINYEIEVSGAGSAAELEAVARDADAESTIPSLLRASTDVVLTSVVVHAPTT